METKPESEAERSALTVAQLVFRLSTSTPEDSSPYFEELIRRFEPILRGTWHRVISKRKLVLGIEYEDFVHDVFVRLFSNLSHLRNHEAFAGYFRQIALSTAYDYLRRSRLENREAMVSTQELEEVQIPPALITAIDEEILTGILIQSYLNHLTAREREVLSLETFSSLSTREIAGILGLSQGAVRTVRMRALNRLRKFVREDPKTATHKTRHT